MLSAMIKKVHKYNKTVIIISIISNATAEKQQWLQACRFCIEAITAAALFLYMLGIFSFFAIHSIIFLYKYATVNFLLLLLLFQ